MNEILLEDNHLLIVVKPFGVATQTEPDGTKGLEDSLKAFIKVRDNKPGQVYLHAVHRIDKPVAGIVVFAKSQKALSRCSESIRNNLWVKEYQALVEGECSSTGVITHYLQREQDRVYAFKEKTPVRQEAQLEIVEAKPQGKNSRLSIRLITGRHHQIRAQLAALGHPILGDVKYGSKQPYKPNAIALIHSKLQLPHPVTKEILKLVCQLEFYL